MGISHYMKRKSSFQKKALPAILFAFINSLCIFAQSTRPVVTDINAFPVSSTKITVSWSLPQKTDGNSISALLVYRSTRPLIDISSFANLEPVAQLPGASLSYTDTVSDTREYYYAVISVTQPGSYAADEELYYDEELDGPQTNPGTGKTYSVLLPGVNATVKGTRAKAVQKKENRKAVPQVSEPEKVYGENELREQPLPFIDVLGDKKEVHERTISEEAERRALQLAGKTKAEKYMLEVHVFEEDLISPAGGDEYLLFEVLRTSFIQKNYKGAEKKLKQFLSQNRKASVTDRAHFYLGESLYYQGKYSDALSQFLLVEERYPALTRKWIESTLDLYNMPYSAQ